MFQKTYFREDGYIMYTQIYKTQQQWRMTCKRSPNHTGGQYAHKKLWHIICHSRNAGLILRCQNKTSRMSRLQNTNTVKRWGGEGAPGTLIRGNGDDNWCSHFGRQLNGFFSIECPLITWSNMHTPQCSCKEMENTATQKCEPMCF